MKRPIVILILLIMNSTAFSQSWIDTTLYPFEHNYLKLEAGSMHYIDEGEGDPILFVHGTPTWSFLYRDFITALSKNNRCIAVDHLGFGLSEKPESAPETPEWHAQNLIQFIEKLDLHNVTLVVHDFGGPIGLASGIKHSDRIKKIVLFNTWLWSTDQSKDAQRIDKIVNSWVGKFLYLNLNFSPKVLLKKGYDDKHKLTKRIHQHYFKPFPDKASRSPLLNLAKGLVGSSGWYQKQWDELDRLAEKDWLIIWGTKDEFITPEYLDRWENRLPNSKTFQLECGHFVQEEKAEESVKIIQEFLRN